MLAFLADENFNNDILDGLRRRNPALVVVRVQDVGLRTTNDPTILAWAAQAGRILLTHDAATMPPLAYQRVAAELPMPGVFLVPDTLPIRRAIEDLLVIAECSREKEWEG